MEASLTDDLHLARWIDDHGRRVSKWEAQFLDAVLRQLERGQACTAKQRADAVRLAGGRGLAGRAFREGVSDGREAVQR